ncbi:amino acid ABC transporter substrate-binding protein [Uliginosibacterium gangwonense]|uniref:amino acid ABC transporter substrate-binding protein n=1 Tax=Uliginosibacterium gangwonense TaxID=392736 RepID=UPI0003AA116F|nr:amino acid ABC transporter substrate-binding protein [Uliginosibacterium gangwonense]
MRHTSKRISPLRAAMFCMALAPLLATSVAQAESGDTVDRLTKTRVINLGVRDLSPPFSTLDKAGKATGYSVDICYKMVDMLRKELKLPDLRAQEVLVTASNRLDKIKDGSIDIECGSTVNTKARQKDVDFSYSVLFGAQRFLTDPKSGINSQNDLAGKTVAVIKGSAGEKIVNALKAQGMTGLTVLQVGNNDEALAALESGKAHAISQMDIILEFVRLKSKTPARFVVTQWPLTVEPIGFPLRKNDARFKTAVNDSLKTLFMQKEFREIYDKWFNKEVRIPPSGLMMENMHRPNSEAGMALVMGVEL